MSNVKKRIYLSQRAFPSKVCPRFWNYWLKMNQKLWQSINLAWRHDFRCFPCLYLVVFKVRKYTVYHKFIVKFLACGRNYNGREGKIKSPNYPNYYSPRANCLYKITVPTGMRVRAKFNNFSVEPAGGNPSKCDLCKLDLSCLWFCLSVKMISNNSSSLQQSYIK